MDPCTYLQLNADEVNLLNKLYFRKSIIVRRLLLMPCFHHLTPYKLYKYFQIVKGTYKDPKLYVSKRALHVIELKRNNVPYKKIANLTGLSINTVYNYAQLDLNVKGD